MTLARWMGIASLGLTVATGATDAWSQSSRAAQGGTFAPAPLALDPDAAPRLEGTRVPGAGNWNAGVAVVFNERPMVVGFGAMGPSLRVTHQIWTHYMMQIGIGRRVALGVDLPVMLHQGTICDPGSTAGGMAGPACESSPLLQNLGWAAPGIASMGDARLSLRVSSRVLGTSGSTGASSDSTLVGQGPGWAAVVNATAPSGDARSFAGAGAWTLHPIFVGDFRLLGMMFALNVGYRARFDASWPLQVGTCTDAYPTTSVSPSQSCIGTVPLRDALTWGVAVRMPPALLGGFAGPYAELNGSIDMRQPGAPNTQPLEWGAGLQRQFGEFTASLGAGMGLTDVPTQPRVRAQLIVQWAPRFVDDDNDGLRDNTGEDHCPGLPEDRDGYEDSDGCPEDNDGDEVPDAEDRCPRQDEDVDGFEDEDGCPDPDNDRDGVPDVQDRCRDLAMGASPDPERPGCPNSDLDGDGVPNTEDQCPEQAPGAHPDGGRPGCPAADRDHDGEPDATDRCPEQPAGARGGEHGCPDPDADHDGVLNESDRCPDAPETINDVDDTDGCAETAPPANARVRVRINGASATSPGTVELLEAVRYTPTHGIDPASQPLLRQLALALVATSRASTRFYQLSVAPAPFTLPALREIAFRAATARRDAVLAALRALGVPAWALDAGETPHAPSRVRPDRGIQLRVLARVAEIHAPSANAARANTAPATAAPANTAPAMAAPANTAPPPATAPTH